MMRRAISMIELLVCIAIFAVLIAIFVPVIGRVRNAARVSASLANIRSHLTTFGAYGNDYKGQFPYFTTPGAFTNVLRAGGVDRGGVSYFDAHRVWHFALADGYYNGEFRSTVFRSPLSPAGIDSTWPFYSHYLYGCVFIADPTFWNEYTRTSDHRQFRPVRQDEVVTPAKKSLISDQFQYTVADGGITEFGPGKWDIRSGQCDGSARTTLVTERLSGYGNGEGFPWTDYGAIHPVDIPTLLHTVDGVRGRDFR